MVTIELENPSLTKTSQYGSVGGTDHVFEESGPYNVTAGEQSMWRAVIVQALMDASSLSKKPENQFHKREALIWLRGTSEDFHRVCHFAGFEPSFVRELVKGALERGCQWRIVPGMGERGMRSREAGDRRDPTARR